MEIDGFQVGRAFCDNDDVSPSPAGHRFAQASFGHEVVIAIEPVIVGQQNVDIWLHVAVLIGIVEENGCHAVFFQDFLNAFSAVGIHCHDGFGKLALHLTGLVATTKRLIAGIDPLKAFALSAVATAQYGYLAMP